MSKKLSLGRVIWLIILCFALVFTYYLKEQQSQKLKPEALKVAIARAESLGYDVNKMIVQSEPLRSDFIVVSFKNNEDTQNNNLEIYLRYTNTYDIKILGVYEDVNPNKDREKIMEDILSNVWGELKKEIRSVKDISKK